MAEVINASSPSFEGRQWSSGDATQTGSTDDSVELSQALMFERTRIRVLAGERENVQKKTFTKWINSHLSRAGLNRVSDIYLDLRDGRVLIRLLNILSGQKLQRPTRGKMRIHSLENVDKALCFLNGQHVHLENIGPHDIVDGNASLTLGLVWTIILRFQIQDITIEEVESSETRSAKDALLLWCQIKTAEYENVDIRNFTTSWRDGMAFNALIHKHRPDLINYKNLRKEQVEYNLDNAFDIAEKKLGIHRLLDIEDVAIEYPDEKSILTYVVTLYHYFSKARADTVQGRRIARIVGCAAENEKRSQLFEISATALIQWINEQITFFSNRTFTNNLEAIQQIMFAFTTYRQTEKPKRQEEKGRLEVLLFILQSRLRMNQQPPYAPKNTLSILNSSWTRLENCEHDYEICLNEEIVRQQRLEQLADKFGQKAAMREKWLNDSQRLIACDKFGSDLSSVEAAFKKQEAIQTDIGAFDERLQNLVLLVNELEAENYHASEEIKNRKNSIMFMWEYLLELVQARRRRLEAAYNSYRILAEIDFILQWIDEIISAIDREDINKNLIQVDDLIQCHDLLKSDIAVVGERVEQVLEDANPFVSSDQTDLIIISPDINAQKKHIDGMVEKVELLKLRYQALVETSMRRDGRLKSSLYVCMLIDDITNEREWIQSKIRELNEDYDLLNSDWIGSQSLTGKYEALRSEIDQKQKQIDLISNRCNEIDENDSYKSIVDNKYNSLMDNWSKLNQAADERGEALFCTYRFRNFNIKSDESNAWMLEMLRVVSCEDVGRDEHAAQNLLKKHEELQIMLEKHRSQIEQLHQEANGIMATDERNKEDVRQRITSTDKRFNELVGLANLRQRKLDDAIQLFRLFHDVDNVEAWITEKERFLYSLDPGSAGDMEELEVMKHRFDGFERELYASASKVAVVNNLSRQLMADDHPGSQQILDKLNNLNQKWSDLRKLVDSKRDELTSTFGVQTFHIECDETISWIQDKVKIVQSTEDLGKDLSGVIIMQRRLSGLERDLNAIQAKLDQLDVEAERLEHTHPMEADTVHQKINQINAVWYELKDTLKRREESMGEAAVLQRFLRDLDHFSQWLTRTQTTVASEDIPSCLQSAEQILNKHQSVKEEIDRYAPDYAQMRDYGQRVIRDADSSDPQYVFLRERLNALDDGWNELDQMWHQKQNMLSEAMHLQMYERDAGLSELLLKNQEYYLQQLFEPKNLDEAEQMSKAHEDFTTSMNASEEKIQQLWQFAQRLVHENHFAADRIIERAHSIVERFSFNKNQSANIGDQLREQIKFYQFVQECDDLKEWVDTKTHQAQDDSYRDTKSIHSKYLRHQAFSAEIAANRERLHSLRQIGFTLADDQPNMLQAIEHQIGELDEMWDNLEETTKVKGERLFDANRDTLYQQCILDVERFVSDLEQHLTTEEDFKETEGVMEKGPETVHGGELTRTNIALTRQALLEQEFILKQQQVEELKEQAERLKTIEPERSEIIEAQRVEVEERFKRIKVPLETKKLKLAKQKRIHQLYRDIDDEFIWIEDHLNRPLEEVDSLLTVRRLECKNEGLRMEAINRIKLNESLKEEIQELSDEMQPDREEQFEQKLSALDNKWKELLEELDKRSEILRKSMNLHKFLVDVEEAQSWISEHELQAMIEETGRDETATRAFIRKHKQVEMDVVNFGKTLEQMKERIANDADLNQQNAALEAMNRLSQLYDSLLELCAERSLHLDSGLRLHLTMKELDDLRLWILEKEAVCSTDELGLDFEHVTLLRQRFTTFAEDTTIRGQERISQVNKICSELIKSNHSQRDLVCEWQNTIAVNMWDDLLEMMYARTIALDFSYKLQKYFYDCKEALALIKERQNGLSDQLGRDAKSVFALQRKHVIFEQDLVSVRALVSQIFEQCCSLSDKYAGEQAHEITRYQEAVRIAWNSLQLSLQKRNTELSNCADMHKFFNLARDLTIWIEGILRQMKNSGLPGDVSGVDLLINNHQGLKAEIAARDENFTICVNMGKDLLAKKHPRSSDIKERCVQLCLLRDLQAHEWQERWEHLQLQLEVYQFARDAAVAEAWLVSQEPYLQIDELGDNLDQVEHLIRKHEAFEKSIVAQEDRFNALKQLTGIEKREQQPPRQPFRQRRSEYEREFCTWDERELMTRAVKTERNQQPQQVAKPAQRHVVSALSEAVIDSNVAGRLMFAGVTADVLNDSAVVLREGYLVKKNLWDDFNHKASNRSWERYFFTLTRLPNDQCVLEAYRDHKQTSRKKKQPEDSWQMVGECQIEPATDYHKRANVFRLTFSQGGASYMFMARDFEDMHDWIEIIRTNCQQQSKGRTDFTRSHSLPLGKEPNKQQEETRRERRRDRSRQRDVSTASSNRNKMASFFSIRRKKQNDDV